MFRFQVALVASHSSGCSFLYPDQAKQNDDLVLRQQDGQYEVFYHLETVIKEKVAEVMNRDRNVNSNECLLSGAMTMALCYINKLQSTRNEAEKYSPRLLVMSSTGDTAAQYINFMNVFFTAQKMNIPVDSCMLLQEGAAGSISWWVCTRSCWSVEHILLASSLSPRLGTCEQKSTSTCRHNVKVAGLT